MGLYFFEPTAPGICEGGGIRVTAPKVPGILGRGPMGVFLEFVYSTGFSLLLMGKRAHGEKTHTLKRVLHTLRISRERLPK